MLSDIITNIMPLECSYNNKISIGMSQWKGQLITSQEKRWNALIFSLQNMAVSMSVAPPQDPELITSATVASS